jgi:hypothetical protein
VVQNHPWVFFLVSVERFAEGHVQQAAIFATIFVANLFVASRWDEIGGFAKRRKMMLPYLALGALGVLFLGIAIGALWRGTLVAEATTTTTVAPKTGRIIWNFEQQLNGTANFLNLNRLNQEEIRVIGYGVHGRNTSTDPVTEISGYIRSDLTNARLPVLLMAQDPNAPTIPNPFQPPEIPTKPEETYGIPGLAEFDIVTFENTTVQSGVDGIPASQFLRDFGAFTVVLEYDGIKIEQKFTSDIVKAAITKFEKTANPERTTAPRVTRRPNAKPPPQAFLPFQPQAQPSAPIPTPSLTPTQPLPQAGTAPTSTGSPPK